MSCNKHANAERYKKAQINNIRLAQLANSKNESFKIDR